MALQISTVYKDIADQIINKFPVAFSQIELDKVLFLEETQKSPKKYADIRNVGSPWNFLTSYKYIITFYEPKMIALNDAQKVMVVFHELLHIDDDFIKLRKHNIEDFRELISKYGINWDIDPNLPNILDDSVTDIPMVIGDDEEEEE
jgi:predicted metallopeptidase